MVGRATCGSGRLVAFGNGVPFIRVADLQKRQKVTVFKNVYSQFADIAVYSVMLFSSGRSWKISGWCSIIMALV